MVPIRSRYDVGTRLGEELRALGVILLACLVTTGPMAAQQVVQLPAVAVAGRGQPSNYEVILARGIPGKAAGWE